MNQEVLKLALEWAEAHGEIVFAGGSMDAVNKMNSWVTAIKEALREHAMREVQRLGQEIEQEPAVGIAAIRTWFKDGRVVTQTLCNSWVDTHPPQRKPLTQDETMEIANQTAGQYWMDEAHIQRFRAALEAAHGIKENT